MNPHGNLFHIPFFSETDKYGYLPAFVIIAMILLTLAVLYFATRKNVEEEDERRRQISSMVESKNRQNDRGKVKGKKGTR